MGTIGSTVARGTSKGKPTVSDTFRHQLQALVEVLQATNPWYAYFAISVHYSMKLARVN